MSDFRISDLTPIGASTVTDKDRIIINNGEASPVTRSVSVETLKQIFGGQGSTIEPQIIDRLGAGDRWENSYSGAWGANTPADDLGSPITASVDIGNAPAALVAWSTVSGTSALPSLVDALAGTDARNYPYPIRAEITNSIKLEGGTWSSKNGEDVLSILTKHSVTVRPNDSNNVQKAKSRIPVHKIAMITNTGDGKLTFTLSASVFGAGYSKPFTFPGRIFVIPVDTIPKEIVASFGSDTDAYKSSQYPTVVDYANSQLDVSDLDTEQNYIDNEVSNMQITIEGQISRMNAVIQYMTLIEDRASDSPEVVAATGVLERFLVLRDANNYASLKNTFDSAMVAAAPYAVSYPTT